MKVANVVFVLCLAVSVSASAADTALKWKDRTSHWTGISGGPTGDPEEMTISTSGGELGERAITKLEIQEVKDQPCRVTMFSEGLPSSGGGNGKQNIFARSDCDGETKKVDVGEDNYAVALQVCTNDKPNGGPLRVKGLKLWGANIDKRGKATLNATPAKFELPNCSKWHAKVSCGEGEVITGVRAMRNTTEGFGGISVRCSPMVVVPKGS